VYAHAEYSGNESIQPINSVSENFPQLHVSPLFGSCFTTSRRACIILLRWIQRFACHDLEQTIAHRCVEFPWSSPRIVEGGVTRLILAW
jgi:hypothetical protein